VRVVSGCLHLGMESPARGHTIFWPVGRTGEAPTHKLSRNNGSGQRTEVFLYLNKSSKVLVCSDNMSVVAYINRRGGVRS